MDRNYVTVTLLIGNPRIEVEEVTETDAAYRFGAVIGEILRV